MTYYIANTDRTDNRFEVKIFTNNGVTTLDEIYLYATFICEALNAGEEVRSEDFDIYYRGAKEADVEAYEYLKDIDTFGDYEVLAIVDNNNYEVFRKRNIWSAR